MDKTLKNFLIALVVLGVINTGLLAYLAFDNISMNFRNKPVVISRDYDKGQSIQKAMKTEKPMLVWFYTDWCRYCQKFAPTFKKVAKDRDVKAAYAVAYVNAEDPVNAEFVKEYDVKGYPTVYIVNKDKKEMIMPMELFSPTAVSGLKIKLLEYIK